MQEEPVLFHSPTVQITSVQVPNEKDVHDLMRFGMIYVLLGVYKNILAIIDRILITFLPLIRHDIAIRSLKT